MIRGAAIPAPSAPKKPLTAPPSPAPDATIAPIASRSTNATKKATVCVGPFLPHGSLPDRLMSATISSPATAKLPAAPQRANSQPVKPTVSHRPLATVGFCRPDTLLLRPDCTVSCTCIVDFEQLRLAQASSIFHSQRRGAYAGSPLLSTLPNTDPRQRRATEQRPARSPHTYSRHRL